MIKLRELEGTTWVGKNELWLDPLGNEAALSDGTLRVEADRVVYTWSHEGKAHQGSVTFRDGGADFQDTFHASTPISFEHTQWDFWGLFDLQGTYPAPEGPPWGWRIYASVRPGGEELVLQMTNITPWGEDGRAVRLTCKKQT